MRLGPEPVPARFPQGGAPLHTDRDPSGKSRAAATPGGSASPCIDSRTASPLDARRGGPVWPAALHCLLHSGRAVR